MKCYYEELGLSREANASEIKTAYRKLALKWHPDKNPENVELAKQQFVKIQSAYDVLSDVQERRWYDLHREQILRGKDSEYEDESLDVFQYFSVSCYKGYADDERGFYAVYREVFKKIAAEDVEFMEDEEEVCKIPEFGDAQSGYEEVVGPFYAYWQAYCTKKTYAWLCPYDIKGLKDRRILREIEKEMKKIVQKAKKERNEEVRNLVAFMRKRDRRVQAYKLQLEERANSNRKKQEQNRLEQLRKRQSYLEEMRQQSSTNNYEGYEEELKKLEKQYNSGSETDSDAASVEDDIETENNTAEAANYSDDLYCVACNKAFGNEKAFGNHELSKKHRANVQQMKLDMQADEEALCEIIADEETPEEILDDEASATVETARSGKKSKKSRKNRNTTTDSLMSDNEEVLLAQMKLNGDAKDEEEDASDWGMAKKGLGRKNKKQAKKQTADLSANTAKSSALPTPALSPISTSDMKIDITTTPTPTHICVTCKTQFPSKNKLFSHLKLANHGVYIAKPSAQDTSGHDKTTKQKRK